MTDWKSFDDFVAADLGPDLVVLRTLGRGSAASVYLAHEPSLDRRVAVKVLSPKAAGNETTRRRFEREARSAARITHSHVTAVHRVGRLSNELPYLVMEYIDGRNLEDSLAASGRVSVEEAREILGQLASGLAAAHEQRIVHRDVKPANILRERGTGRIVLTDFGLAAARDRVGDTTKLTVWGQVLGDLPFVSPEHLKGDPLTELADMYALGVVGYQLLAGRGPYDATSAATLTAAHLRESPVPLQQLRPDVDRELAELMARCLAKRPEQRPSAATVAAVLEGRGERAEPAPTTVMGQFFAELRRRRVYRVGAAYAAVAVALIGLTEGIEGPLNLSDAAYRGIIGVVLAGLPITLALSWMFDLRAGRIERTEDTAGDVIRTRIIPAIALLVSLLVAALIWRWVVMRGSA